MKLGKLKVVQLRKELDARGLDSSGTRPILMRRLRAAMESEPAPAQVVSQSHNTQPEQQQQNARAVSSVAMQTQPETARHPEARAEHTPSEQPQTSHTAAPGSQPRAAPPPTADHAGADKSQQQNNDDLVEQEAVAHKGAVATGSLTAATNASFDERMKLRRERFGSVPAQTRKTASADTPVTTSLTAVEKEREILKRRALKFGLTEGRRTANNNLSADELERRLKRQRRFQNTGSTTV